MSAADELIDTIRLEGQGPVYYLNAVLLALPQLGWATGTTPAPAVLRTTMDALYGADGQGLDPADVYPHVTLWCLRLNGHLAPVPGLDQQLYDWRIAAEDAAGERFHWLPSFPEHAP